MHVALNAHLLSFGDSYRGAGISRYIRQLLVHLRKLDQVPITVFLGDHRVPENLAPGDRFYNRVSRLPTAKPVVRMIWEQLWQPVELALRDVDVLHSLGYVQPLVCPARSVVTVYDLSFLRYPESFNRLNRSYLRLFTKMSVQRTNRIIAASESTKRDMVDLLRVPAEKIRVVYPGVEGDFAPLPRERVEAFRVEHGLPERFILYCGTIEPRKNIDLLVEAFALLRKSGTASQKLVVAGAKGWLFDRVFAAVEKHGLGSEVLFPGYLPSEHQPLWYNAADVFVYPSRYEGFGFPPLEAMACGTPVIASKSSSLPEVVGEGGYLVEEMTPQVLAEAMRVVIGNRDLRDELAARGLARARSFSWERAARETLEVYRSS